MFLFLIISNTYTYTYTYTYFIEGLKGTATKKLRGFQYSVESIGYISEAFSCFLKGKYNKTNTVLSVLYNVCTLKYCMSRRFIDKRGRWKGGREGRGN